MSVHFDSAAKWIAQVSIRHRRASIDDYGKSTFLYVFREEIVMGWSPIIQVTV